MANYRDRRLAQEIQKEVNQILRKKVRDPRVQDVTITDVKVTGDLQQATIYYTILS
ncbi:MAG TPA: 30S ribosome-binding factor RbfA, partial [Enterococcus columbae]|nr:30S ribosome-binding factor RbfA [Enterococcus columbae]